MQSIKKAKLILENGLEFEGYSFGYNQPACGEVVFSTAMVGYPESLTDPSYSGQMLCVTYPIVGNYGVPADELENGISKYFESDKIHVKALIISDYSFNYSHWNASKSLDQWLKEEKIPGIFGIDTRELTKVLRDNGAMMGKIEIEGCDNEISCSNPNLVNQVDIVSCKEIVKYNQGCGKKVVLLDCGVKNSILRTLAQKDVEVIRVPWNYNFNELEYDGLIISNGPGNPEYCNDAVENIKVAMERNKPIFGICMGNQLLGKAAGAGTIKLKSGHRTHNQPVIKVGTTTCYITTQNHGYALDASTLNAEWEPLYENLNDGSNEGIRHKTKPFFAIQFQPDGVEFLFDEFIKML